MSFWLPLILALLPLAAGPGWLRRGLPVERCTEC